MASANSLLLFGGALPSSPWSIPGRKLSPTLELGRGANLTLRRRFERGVVASVTESSSSSSIFLPFLDEEEEEEREGDGDEVDPVVEFFRSRVGITRDAETESKLTLKKNRKTAWHLSIDKNSEPEQFEIVTNPADVSNGVEEKETREGERDSVVSEIVRAAKCLGSDVTFGEVLGQFEGRVSERECWEALEEMGKEGERRMVVCCLYFYEWMGLQEPSLVTPRACTVLFPVLGRAGMGEELMVLFRNLPRSRRRMRDVHVFNAAISGLLCCGR